jgi:selenide, water dikinase
MITTDLVLLGGGHTHALVLKQWGMNPVPGVRITLLSDRSSAAYSGMLPGHLAGFYRFEDCHIDLRHLAEFAGAQFYLDRAVGLDLAQGQVLCDRRPPVAYDWLSIDIGSVPDRPEASPDFQGTPIKPVHHFLSEWNSFLQEIQAQPDYPWHCAIVGGGAGGVELVLALQARIRRLARQLPSDQASQLTVQFHLIHGGAYLMTGHGPTVQQTFEQCLRDRGVAVYLQEQVISVTASPPRYVVETAAGRTLPCDRVFWTTQATAPDWIAQSGLATDDRGFIWVTDTLQSCSHPQVFASGDIATMQNHPRPKAGVFAVRQGKPLYENLKAVLQGRTRRPFVPQKAILGLIGDGEGRAAASRGGWGLPLSPGLWHWKDQIDRRFMAKFQNLPPRMGMRDRGRGTGNREEERAGWGAQKVQMYCAGCGSKVGHQVLGQTLDRLRQEGRLQPDALENEGDIRVGVGSGDDAAVIESRPQQLLVQSVDFFTSPFSDPFITGQITTEHCLNDLYALGATPHSALAIVTVPHGQPRPQAETLYQLLAGVVEQLRAVGAHLLGGHTIEGETLALGLTCNGWVSPGDLWQKRSISLSPASAGEVLILTKPLGTGTLFVAQKQGKAKAAWLDAAMESMTLSHAPAVEVLRQYGATACTDVTGFGLWGHATELLRWTTATIELDLEAIPLLPGAVESLREGHFSSLYPQNLAYRTNNTSDRLIFSTPDPEQHPHWPALFDPQTSGGLLAVIPSATAENCLQALRQAGYRHSAIVGTIV